METRANRHNLSPYHLLPQFLQHNPITVQCQPIRVTGDGAVGIDLGCKEAITLSTGEQISKPEFIKEGQQKVKVASKELRRKQSPNRKKKIKASRR